MNGQNQRTGQAMVPVVISDGANQLGAVAAIIALAKSIDSNRCKLFCSDDSFTKQSTKHYRKELLRLLDSICNRCKIPYCQINISAKNIQAAAINDAKLEINGFSADVSVFIAMLSAMFGIEVPQNCIFSGHISKGQILPVASLAVKLQTAIEAGTEKFYCGILPYPLSIFFELSFRQENRD